MRFLKYLYASLFCLLLCLFVVMIAYGLGEDVIITPGADKTHPLLKDNQAYQAYGANQSVYESPSKDFRLYAGGYFQGDLLSLHNAQPLKGDANLRAARLSLGFDYHKFYQFYVSYDFATSRLYNLVFTYDNFSYFTASVGQFSPIFGLENTSNTAFLTFLEMSLPSIAFSPPYVPGVQIGFYHSPYVFYAMVFTPTLGSTVVGRTPCGAAFTAAWVPIHADTQVVHLGVSGWHQSMDSRHILELSAQPEVFSYNEGVLLDTGNMNYVSNYDVIDGAAALEEGPFEIQSEYSYTWVNRDLHFSSPQFSGYYVAASYFLTGESRLYNFKYASFVDITPIKGRYGAWQVAVRYSELNLNNRGILGGREQNVSAGLNWYPMRHIEVLLNYVRAMATPNTNGFNQTANMYALRLQFVY